MSAPYVVLNNQPPALVDYNLFTYDPVLSSALDREGAEWARAHVDQFGRVLGTEGAIRLGFEANENPPVLLADDVVEFHPSWHALLRLSKENGVHALPWQTNCPGAHVARAALMYLASQNEAGHTCPISMTYASVPAIRKSPEMAKEWVPRIAAFSHDPRFRPASEKSGVMIGMSMTERQGGSDVRANTTSAEPLSGSEYRITGAKWFCSAPMNDAFLILAQAPAGLTCFLLPRWTPEGKRNEFHIERLKPKLGNRSECSADSLRRRLGASHRRGGPRSSRHYGDGAAYQARLHYWVERSDAPGVRAGAAPRGASHGVRQAVDRTAADADGAGGSGAGIECRHAADDANRTGVRCPRIRYSRGRLRASLRRWRSTGSANAAQRLWWRRWNASAGTAISTIALCRASIARRLSIRFGRVAAM